ncbi:hypothetical protein TNCV_2900671 [Trichonephila clavipes]|nr:hypothetical protein TNCV_2900671 [Trichonephila clavipes]
MNPIEHVWDALGRRVAGRKPPPQTLQEGKGALLEDFPRVETNGATCIIVSQSGDKWLYLHFSFPRVETNGATCIAAGVRIGSESSQTVQND